MATQKFWVRIACQWVNPPFKFLNPALQCMPYRYGTASYNFCSLQVTHRIDLPSVILQLWLFLITHTVNTSAFYSFGVSAGDTQFQQLDGASSGPINLPVPIPFFGSPERTLYVSPQLVLRIQTCHTYCIFSFNDPGPQVNTNGVLSFRDGFTAFTSQRFPLSNGRSLIAPFWDDVDIRTSEGGFGNIFYRLTFNTTLLERTRDQLQELFPSTGSFTPTQLVIATWDRVAEFGQRGPQVSMCMHE